MKCGMFAKTRLTKMKERTRDICIKASELSGQPIVCEESEPFEREKGEGPWFWLCRTAGVKDYSAFWQVFDELEAAFLSSQEK